MKRLLTDVLHFVPAVWPVDLNTAANPGDYVSLKNYPAGAVVISINTAAGTAVVTMLQATTVAGAGEKALSFTKYWMTGTKLKINTKTGIFTVGETVTGAGGGSGVVYKDCGTYLLLYTVNATAFVDEETVTGGTSLHTAVANGVGIEEDILLPCTCADTFTIPAVANRTYVVPFEAMNLDVANDFDCARVNIAQASGAGIGSAIYVLEGWNKGRPMQTAIYD